MDPAVVTDSMSATAWAALIIPIVFTTIIGPWLAYKYAVKTAEKKAVEERRLAAEAAEEAGKHESRRMDLQEWQAMTQDLRLEIQRLRAARDEDDKKLDRLALRLEQLEDEREKLEFKVARLENWAREVITALRLPAVASVLLQHQILIPPPPLADDVDLV